MGEELVSSEEARRILQRINAMYPHAKSELNWDNHFHLLCAVLMSAQTTDKMVNRVTQQFFVDYPTPASLAQAPIREIERHISQIGLFRNKAKHLKKTAQILTKRFGSKVPQSKTDLLILPGVGEKTANVVLADGFGIPAIAVDRHVARIAKKFRIVKSNAKPKEVERRLEELLPRKDWIHTHHALILFGRYTMPARVKDKNPYDFLR